MRVLVLGIVVLFLCAIASHPFTFHLLFEAAKALHTCVLMCVLMCVLAGRILNDDNSLAAAGYEEQQRLHVLVSAVSQQESNLMSGAASIVNPESSQLFWGGDKSTEMNMMLAALRGLDKMTGGGVDYVGR